ncbi:Appr-1-p processing protein [bacterium]|nr:MAG: Appr-1-p processing protein [bacterium]
MIPITYLKGDATAPSVKGPQIIAHVSNDLGGWGKGFVLALSKRFPEPERAYRAWHRDRANNDFGLGAAQLVNVGRDLWVANMIGQHGKTYKSYTGPPPVRYEASESALGKVGDWALEYSASVHMPLIGAGLAGGKWEKIEPLIMATLSERDVAVWVYDFE